MAKTTMPSLSVSRKEVSVMTMTRYREILRLHSLGNPIRRIFVNGINMRIIFFRHSG